jgi:hypothetical protein
VANHCFQDVFFIALGFCTRLSLDYYRLWNEVLFAPRALPTEGPRPIASLELEDAMTISEPRLDTCVIGVLSPDWFESDDESQHAETEALISVQHSITLTCETADEGFGERLPSNGEAIGLNLLPRVQFLGQLKHFPEGHFSDCVLVGFHLSRCTA